MRPGGSFSTPISGRWGGSVRLCFRPRQPIPRLPKRKTAPNLNLDTTTRPLVRSGSRGIKKLLVTTHAPTGCWGSPWPTLRAQGPPSVIRAPWVCGSHMCDPLVNAGPGVGRLTLPHAVGATHASPVHPGSQTAKCKHCAGHAIRARHASPLRTRLSAHQFPTPGGAGGASSYNYCYTESFPSEESKMVSCGGNRSFVRLGSRRYTDFPFSNP